MSLAFLLVGGYSLLQFFSHTKYLGLRRKIYGQVKFMEGFESDHTIGLGSENRIHPYGDPDNVDGWYSKQLSYTEWYKLSCAKRAYLELTESNPYSTILVLLGSLKLPYLALGFGTTYFIS